MGIVWSSYSCLLTILDSFHTYFSNFIAYSVSFYFLTIDSIKNSVLVELFPSLTNSYNLSILIVLVILLSVISFCLVLRYFGQHVVPVIKSKPHAPQAFRRRDKIRYHVNRFSRRFSEMTERLQKAKTKEERRAVIVNFARRLFKIRDSEKKPALAYSRLPESFFEPDEEDDSTLPEDLRLIMSSIRVFGHLEKSFLIESCKFIKTIHLNPNDHLFVIGDPDANLYVVRSGKIQVYIKDSDGRKHIINEVVKGGSIESLLSVLNVITGNSQSYQHLEAIALEPATVLCLPTKSFIELCKQKKAALFRIIQIIMVRLQRLSFNALHNYFGISSELFNQDFPSALCQSEAYQYLHGIFNTKPNICSKVEISNTDLPHSEVNKIELDDFSTLLDEINDPCRANISQPDALELGEAPQLIRRPSILAACQSPSLPPSPSLGDRKRYFPRRTQSTDFVIDQDNQKLETVPNIDAHYQASSDIKTSDLSAEYSLSNEEIQILLDAAEKDLAKLLNLGNSDLVHGYVNLVSVSSGTILSKISEMQTEMYLVVYGRLEAVQSSPDGDTVRMFFCGPGDVAGLFGLLTGEPNIYTVKCVEKSVLAIFPRECFYAVVRQFPESLFSVSRILSSRMSTLLHNLDFALEWIPVKAGKALYKKGDTSSHVYVVLTGRLRQVDNLVNGGHRVVGELGRGDFVGFLEVICCQSRVNTVMAIRDSELVRIPLQLLHYLIQTFPQVLSRLIQLLSDKLLGNLKTTSKMTNSLGMPILQMTSLNSFNAATTSANNFPTHGTNPNSDILYAQLNSGAMSNLHTIAILPTTSDVNAEAFTLELQHSMCPYGSTVRFTSRIVLKRLGSNAFDSVSQYRLSAWLNHQEDLHRMVFFVCDCKGTSAWNRICIRQADCVLVLALGNSDPLLPSPIEMALKNDPTKVAKILILMYPLDTDHPACGQTAIWLNNRPWISQHYHIRCEPRVFSARSNENLIKFYSQVFAHETPNPLSDFSRLTRYLTGEAVGLVLGGGGARGCSHVGLIRAFQESGIPIDIIGGTSIGAFMSALWAEETRIAQFTQRARNFTSCFNPVWNKIKDFTYPSVSIFSGRELNNQLESVFQGRQIEDLWLPCFCITTDISNCKMRIHTQGSAWRYVRASMSLSGYLPPLCDPHDGSLLLDGGYTNNLPADVMACLGAKTIFANDVGAAVETGFSNYGDHLSGWYILYNRFLRTDSSAIRIPSLTEIQARLAYISSVRQLEYVKASGICHYLRPPIDQFMTLQFFAFDQINSVGYEYTKEMLSKWYEDGRLENLFPGVRLQISSSTIASNVIAGQPCCSNSTNPPTLNDDTITHGNTNWITQSFGDQFIFVDLADCVARTNKSAERESSTSTETEHGADETFFSGLNHIRDAKDSPKQRLRSTVSALDPPNATCDILSLVGNKLGSVDSVRDDMTCSATTNIDPFKLQAKYRTHRHAFSDSFYALSYISSSDSVLYSDNGEEQVKVKKRISAAVPLHPNHRSDSNVSNLLSIQRNTHNVDDKSDEIHKSKITRRSISSDFIDQLTMDPFIEDGYVEDDESDDESPHSHSVVSDPEWRHNFPMVMGHTHRPRFSSTPRIYPTSTNSSDCDETNTNITTAQKLRTHHLTSKAIEKAESSVTKQRDKQKHNRRLHHRSSLDKLRKKRDESATDSA